MSGTPPTPTIPSVPSMSVTVPKMPSPMPTVPGAPVAMPRVETTRLSIDDIVFDEPIDMLSEDSSYRIMTAGPTNVGKTHFLCSCKPPVINLEVKSENRLKHIVGKFDDPITGKQKDIKRKMWSNFDQLDLFTDAAIALLDKHFEATGKHGTIGIETMGDVWDKAQKKYKLDTFGDEKAPVRLDPLKDWKEINRIHNDWRDKLLGCGHNVCLTTTISNTFDKNDRYNPSGVKPDGQKGNMYKVDFFIMQYQQAGSLYGKIQKSTFTKEDIPEIKEITFEKFEKAISEIRSTSGIRTLASLKEEIATSKTTTE